MSDRRTKVLTEAAVRTVCDKYDRTINTTRALPCSLSRRKANTNPASGPAAVDDRLTKICVHVRSVFRAMENAADPCDIKC